MSNSIILISADIEWKILKNLLPRAVILDSPMGEWFSAVCKKNKIIPTDKDIEPLPSGDIIFFHGGWGKIAAASSAQYVIDRWQPELLVNLGTCGGFAGLVKRNTVILADKTIVYDIIEQMGDFEEHIAHYSTDIDLSWLGDNYPTEVLPTLLVSGDRDLVAEEIPELHSRYGAVAGDWESGAIAYVAAQNCVRTLILRGVTDLVGEDGGEAYGNIQLFEKATEGIMTRLVKALPSWLEAAKPA